jgi:hypothetical protein
MRAIDAHFEMFGFRLGDRVYLRFNFDSRRVITTHDYSALNWRELSYGAAAQGEEDDQEYAALSALRGSVVWRWLGAKYFGTRLDANGPQRGYK